MLKNEPNPKMHAQYKWESRSNLHRPNVKQALLFIYSLLSSSGVLNKSIRPPVIKTRQYKYLNLFKTGNVIIIGQTFKEE